MPRPLTATVDIAAMQSNLACAKAFMPDSKAWAVVKANAYGHGLANGMLGFAAADGLALVELDAAIRLRQMGWQKPILLLEGVFEPLDLQIVRENSLETVVHCTEQVEMLEKEPDGSSYRIHLKMNTGMNRLGFLPDQFIGAYKRLSGLKSVEKISFITHFANSEVIGHAHDGVMPDEQVRRFNDVLGDLKGERSIANSAAIMLRPELHADWIRPGIMLYGASPGGKTAREFGLQPAMTLTSKIIAIQEISKGQSIGYGSLFTADKRMKIGVVACGYADGYPRHASTGTPVLVNGIRTRVLGRVSMDMMTVDLSEIPDAALGSEVSLWGGSLPIDEVAQAAGTIGYELMCALAPRVTLVATASSQSDRQEISVK